MNSRSNKTKSLLQTLSQTKGERAEKILLKEADKLLAAIDASDSYREVKEALELLDIFVYRVSERAANGLSVFLNAISGKKFIVSEEERIYLRSEVDEILTIETLKLLEKIRYHMPDAVIEAAMSLAADAREDVRDAAVSVLAKMAHFDIAIFYGGDTGWGLGAEPQQKVFGALQKIPTGQANSYSALFLSVCAELLSGEMEGVEADYRKMSISRTYVPASAEVRELRTRVLRLIATLYRAANTKEDRKKLLDVMLIATQAVHGVKPPEEYNAMISEDTAYVLETIYQQIPNMPLDEKEAIEGNVYHLYVHDSSTKVRERALAIKSNLDGDKEFQIFKTLIGFEGVFHDWDAPDSLVEQYEEIEEKREAAALRFVDEIQSETYDLWKDRISLFAQTESNDLATFPLFGKFLDSVGAKKPLFAVLLLQEGNEKVLSFSAPLLIGLWRGDQEKARSLMTSWIEQSVNLFQVARFLQLNPQLDIALLSSFSNRAFLMNDPTLWVCLTAIAATHFDQYPSLADDYFVPALKKLNVVRDVRWAWSYWYRKERGNLLRALRPEAVQVVLENLQNVTKIDYRVEEVLTCLVERSLDQVLAFFKHRIMEEPVLATGAHFDPIPYEFHTLDKALQDKAHVIVPAVREWFNNDDRLFRFRGGRFLRALYKASNKEFCNELTALASTGVLGDSIFVTEVLSNYKGEVEFHGVFKALIANAEDGNNDLATRIVISLDSMGVVRGEYGFSDAYARKASEVALWLSDENDKVRKFAERYISQASENSVRERKRADANIAVQKMKYGPSRDKNSEEPSDEV